MLCLDGRGRVCIGRFIAPSGHWRRSMFGSVHRSEAGCPREQVEERINCAEALLFCVAVLELQQE